MSVTLKRELTLHVTISVQRKLTKGVAAFVVIDKGQAAQFLQEQLQQHVDQYSDWDELLGIKGESVKVAVTPHGMYDTWEDKRARD